MEERPLECSQCKKQTTVTYQEIVGKDITVYHMCTKCPILKQKLEGKQTPRSVKTGQLEKELSCSRCNTTLESVLLGHPLGCAACYEVFQDVLTDQLSEINSSRSILHVGKSPETEPSELSQARLNALNEDLSDALKGENYEQAAWLRDQINSLPREKDERR